MLRIIQPTAAQLKPVLSAAVKACAAVDDTYERTQVALQTMLAVQNGEHCTVLCVASTMSGKSTIERALPIALTYRYPDDKHGIIFLQNISDTDLFNQSIEGFATSEGYGDQTRVDGINYFESTNKRAHVACVMLSGGAYRKGDSLYEENRSRLLKIIRRFITLGCTRITLDIDEIHQGVRENGQLDNFTNELNALVDDIRSETSRFGLQHFIQVFGFTATPSIFYFQKHTKADIRVVYIPPGKGYTSAEALLNSGRVKTFEEFDDDTMARMILSFKPGKGYVLMRQPMQGRGGTAISRMEKFEKFISLLMEAGFNVRYYHSSPSGDNEYEIEQLQKDLARKPKGRTVLVIKNALSVGNDLVRPDASGTRVNRRQHIIAWIGNRFSSEDPTIQSDLGRNTGYNNTDTFPIWISVNAWDRTVSYIDDMNKIAAGIAPEPHNERKGGVIMKPDLNSLRGGTRAEYEEFCLKVGQDKGYAKSHKVGYFDSLVNKSAVRYKSTRALDFSGDPSSEADAKAKKALLKRLRAENRAKGGSGIVECAWFERYVKKTSKLSHGPFSEGHEE